MTHRTMAMTYAPKIEGFLAGTIRQTIREGDKVKVGDTITFHGWEGKPYRTPWSWRKTVTVAAVQVIWVNEEGWGCGEMVAAWSGNRAGRLAELDGIDPPTGEALKATLERLRGRPFTSKREPYQIIRW